MTYSIGEAAERTGIKPVTLRAWESRYGVVTPSRRDSSYREYTEHDLEVLRRMSLLVESGVPARRAATMAAAGGGHQPKRSPAAALSGLQDTAAVARAGAAFDAGGLRRILDEAFAVASPEVVVDDWLMPSMQQVGLAWDAGDLDVVCEHFISAAVMRKLAALFEATPAHGPRVVVGLPASARHELPALAFSLLLQRTGTQVLYVGCDVPVSSWDRVVRQWQPSAAVIGAASPRDVSTAREAVLALSDCDVALVFVGGQAADQVEGGVKVPQSLSAAAESVAAALSYRRP